MTAVCCFTPILIAVLGLVGLAALTPYLDYLILPALGLFLILIITGLWQKNRQS
jgi:mercuric ion transport protein